MIFEGPDCSFCGIYKMFFRWNTLESSAVLMEVIFQGLGALVVRDVKIRWVTLFGKDLVSRFPGILEAGCLAIRECNGVNGVCILIIQNEDVMITAARRDKEATSLTRVAFENR